MAYYMKKREEFLEHLQNVKINELPKKQLIEDFRGNGLSDLYELFMKLKDFFMTDKQYYHLYEIISNNYSQEILKLLNNPISVYEINQLLDLIKITYLQIVTQDNNLENIPKDEINSLKMIVNQHFPDTFPSLIKSPISAEEYSKQQELIRKTVCDLSDNYYYQASSHGQKNSDYLGSAIYLIYRKLHPEFSISVPGRTKGFQSFVTNIHKELDHSVKDMVASDINKGITLSDEEKYIISNLDNPKNFTDKTNSDFSGITIVLHHMNDTVYFDEKDSDNVQILELRRQRNKHLHFIHNIKRFLSENDIFLSQEEYFQISIQLLEYLQDSTYPECTHEIKEGSYSSKLKLAIENHQKHLKENSFCSSATNEEIEELYSLIDCLNKNLDDKLQHEILKVTFPHVLEDSLLTDDFKIKGKFIKDVKKANGFCAIYFELTDAYNRKTEVQLQSNMRYKETKNGLSAHNHIQNKTLDIRHFFELSDGSDNPELLERYLTILDRTSHIQTHYLNNRLYSKKSKLNYVESPKEKRDLQISIGRLEQKLKLIEIAKNSVKIKDEFIEEHDMIDMDATKKDDNYELRTIGDKTIKLYNTVTKKRIEKYRIENYLPNFAKCHSPVNMNVISSAHATAPEAHINNKTLIESFTEILRDGDEVSYLSEILINKLEEILNIKNSSQISYEELSNYAKENFYNDKNIDNNLEI